MGKAGRVLSPTSTALETSATNGRGHWGGPSKGGGVPRPTITAAHKTSDKTVRGLAEGCKKTWLPGWARYCLALCKRSHCFPGPTGFPLRFSAWLPLHQDWI